MRFKSEGIEDFHATRIHPLAGILPEAKEKNELLWSHARTTYVANLRRAAEECSKVGQRVAQRCVCGPNV